MSNNWLSIHQGHFTDKQQYLQEIHTIPCQLKILPKIEL